MRNRADTKAIPLSAGTHCVLCSDGNAIYPAFSEQVHIVHKQINLSAGTRVVIHAFHTQKVNSNDSRIKFWIVRVGRNNQRALRRMLI